MGATFSRTKTWIAGETLTAADLNTEFDSILTNFTPAGMDDDSVNNAAMQATRDPYPGDAISLATDLSGELRGIRHVLKEAFGSAQWYISSALLPLGGGTMTGAIVLPAGSAAAPAIGWTDTGFYEVSADVIGISTGGTVRFKVDSTGISANNAAGPVILDEAATSTNPTLAPNKADPDTGVGWATDELHAIINGASVGTFDANGLQGIAQLQTETATTSGTEHDYTSIPSWVKKITIMFAGVSTNGTSIPIIQLGDAGGFETSGYLGSASNIAAVVASTVHNTGFLTGDTHAATTLLHGVLVLNLEDASNNVWAITGTLSDSAAAVTKVIAGTKALTAALTQIRLTTVNGTDAFDAGAINIMVE